MQPFESLRGVAAPLEREDVDTDAIIPQRWLVTVQRSGLAAGLFAGWRFDAEGRERADFVLNQPAYRQARILVAGANYGCGSSREHAVWAHLDYGIGAVIAPSYGPIFQESCLKNGLPAVVLPAPVVVAIQQQLRQRPGAECAVDLRRCEVMAPDGVAWPFTMDEGRRQALLQGIDDIGATLQQEAEIAHYQAQRRAQMPWDR